MTKMIRKYGEKDKNGKMYISKNSALEYAPETLVGNLEWRPYDARARIAEHFDKIWNHMDVAHEGKIDVS